MINKLIAIAAIVVAPSLASAQSLGSNWGTGGSGVDTTDTTGGDTTRSDTSMMNQSDSAMMDTMRTDTTDSSTYRDTTEERGEIYTPPRGALAARNMGLSTDQVKELQQAINDAGCHAGTVDGVIGPVTREGIACIREQQGIEGEDVNDVLSALGLSFTTSPNATSSPDTTTAPSSYQSDTTTTPTMDTTRSMDSSMVTDTTTSMDTTTTMDTTTPTDTTSVMDTTTMPDTTTPRDTSSAYPPTTNPVDTTMDPMNPMHQTDTTLSRPDTSGVRGRN